MLAHVFWHWPRQDVDLDRYAEALVDFHRTLSSARPPGYHGSRVREVAGAPWTPAGRALED